jgi:HAD superfamily hydrolase (TIGR01484 family)
MKQLIAFDLDGTLAQSKQAIDAEMGTLLAQLTQVARVTVISGGDWPQFEAQLVANLPDGADLGRLWLMPTSGTKLYRFEGKWTQVYAETFDADERRRILAALDKAVAENGLDKDRSWGEKIEDRGSQITFSGLGQQAPLDAKTAWDPDFAKRKRLQATLTPLLPGFSVKIGGSTSLDVTREGVDKAYGMRRLSEETGLPPQAILFLGDAVYPGGNDYPVRAAGIDTVAVRDIEECKRVIEAIIACLRVS